MLKAQLIERVAALETELEAAKAAATQAAPKAAELTATVMFCVRNNGTGTESFFALEGLTRKAAEDHARLHGKRIGNRFTVTFYPVAGTEA